MLSGKNNRKSGTLSAGNDCRWFTAAFGAQKFVQNLNVIGGRQDYTRPLGFPESQKVQCQNLMGSSEVGINLRPFVGRSPYIDRVQKKQGISLARFMVNELASSGVKDTRGKDCRRDRFGKLRFHARPHNVTKREDQRAEKPRAKSHTQNFTP